MAADGVRPDSGTLGSLVNGVSNGFNTLDDDELDAWLAEDPAEEDENEIINNSHQEVSSNCLNNSSGLENNTTHEPSLNCVAVPLESESNVVKETRPAAVETPDVVSSIQQPKVIKPVGIMIESSTSIKNDKDGLSNVKTEEHQIGALVTINNHKKSTAVVKKTGQSPNKTLGHKVLGQQLKGRELDNVLPVFEEKFKRLSKPRIRDLIEHEIFQEGDRLNYLSRVDNRDFPCSVTSRALDSDKRLLVDLFELPLLLRKIPFLMKQQEEGVKGIAFTPLPDSKSPSFLLMSVSFFKLLALWYKEDFRDGFRFKSDLHAYDDKELVVVKMRGLVLSDPVPLKAIRDQFAEDVGWDFDRGVCRCSPPHSRIEMKNKLQRYENNGRKSLIVPSEFWALGRSPSSKSSEGGPPRIHRNNSQQGNGREGRIGSPEKQNLSAEITSMNIEHSHVSPQLTLVDSLGKRPQDLEIEYDEQKKRLKLSVDGEGLGGDQCAEGQRQAPDPEVKVENLGLSDSALPTLNICSTHVIEMRTRDEISDVLTSSKGISDGRATGQQASKDKPGVESNGASGQILDNLPAKLVEEVPGFSFDPNAFFDKVRSPLFIERLRASASSITATNGSSPRGESKRRAPERVVSIENVKNLLASWDARKRTASDLSRMVTSICTHEDTRNAMQRQFQAAARTLAKAQSYIDVRTHLLKLVLIVGDDRKYVGMYAAEAVMLACQNANIKSGLQKDVAAKEVLKNLRSRYGGQREKINAKAGDLLAQAILGKVK